MTFIPNDTGNESSFNRQSRPITEIPPPINGSGIAHTQRFRGALQAIFPHGNGDEVNVVGHRTVGENLHSMATALFLQPFEMNPTVFFGKKHILSAITAQSDVAGKFRGLFKKICG
uniref:Uncharacterized protein n=1 Tax=Candidatus Kentrum sp. TC TaxID=2126339 RepID=A0A451A4F3_9GAMM|nr:MAG: hypothetical protein BECKTC1821F_GA0114240_105113 [Candidatus Kentron sp. TC]